ncbi:MAG: DUF4249 family protein [candidate division WOR-3 bacterium]
MEVRRQNRECRTQKFRVTHWLILAAVLLAAACDSTPDEYKPEPNVYCLLRSDCSTTRVLCGMTRSYDDSVSESDDWQGVTEATVEIGHNGERLVLRPLPDSAGRYITDSLLVVPRDTYTLSVYYPEGQKVSGTTVVPDTFAIVSIQTDTQRWEIEPGVYMYEFRARARWSASRGASGYLLTAEIRYSGASETLRLRDGPYVPMGREGETWFGGYVPGRTGQDTLFLDRVRFRVWALDRNYSDYLTMRWGGQRASDNLMHLDGAVGVFGSACIAETTLHFTPPH